MRTKLVKRHYCDFCNKGSMVAASMTEHEKTCLRNPQRSCFLCKEARQSPAPMADIVNAIITGSGVELADARAVTGGCPACILAGILQAKKDPRWSASDEIDDECGNHVSFDYKKEKDEWYAERVEPMDF